MNISKKKVIVVQLGARMHYAVPQIFYKKKYLKTFYTDAYYNNINNFHKYLPNKIRKQMEKYNPKIDSNKIVWDWFLALKYRIMIKKVGYKAHQWAAKKMSNKVIKNEGNQKNIILYSFDLASKDLFFFGKKKWYLVLEQCVAPRSTQKELLINNPEFDYEHSDLAQSIKMFDELHEIEKIEWELSDKIICPSNYVKNEIVKCNSNLEKKICVVPYGVDFGITENNINLIQNKKQNRKKIILFAGSICYRKGAYDIKKIALKYQKSNVEFRLAGSININKEYFKDLPANIKILGKLSKDKLISEYKKAYIFLFPTYLEGSATVIYEALNYYLPVITTHSAGSVITEGKDGYIVDEGDIGAFVKIINSLLSNDKKYNQVANEAFKTSKKYTVDAYGERLIKAIMSTDFDENN